MRRSDLQSFLTPLVHASLLLFPREIRVAELCYRKKRAQRRFVIAYVAGRRYREAKHRGSSSRCFEMEGLSFIERVTAVQVRLLPRWPEQKKHDGRAAPVF